jgi:hypothetical protein
MKKEQLVTFGIIVIGIVGLLFFMFNPITSEEKDSEQQLEEVVLDDFEVINPTAKAIKAEITTLGEKKWNKTEYADIDSRIRVSLANKLIDNSEHESLANFLNVSNINTLNKAAVNFFSSSRNAGELLSIYNELKRYANITTYRQYVVTMKNACADFYSLQQLQTRIAGFDYFSGGEENQVTTYFRNLDNFGNKNYLSKSPLVKDIISNSKKKLQSKMSLAVVTELKPKIQNYITLEAQSDGITNNYKQQLSDLENNRFLSNDSYVLSFAQKTRQDLNSHEEVALQMGSLKFNPKSCEEICIKHLYYIQVCKENKQTNQESQETINRDSL